MQKMTSSISIPASIEVYSPLVSQQKFAEMIGVSVGSVEAAVARRHWPVLKIGRHRYINIEAIRLAAIKTAEAEEYSL
jgi:hypothetical protein